MTHKKPPFVVIYIFLFAVFCTAGSYLYAQTENKPLIEKQTVIAAKKAFALDEFEESYNLFSELEAHSIEKNDTLLYIQSFSGKAIAKYFLKDYRAADSIASTAITVYSQNSTNDTTTIAEALYTKASILKRQGQYAEAFPISVNLLSFLYNQQSTDSVLLARTHALHGSCYYGLGNSYKALDAFKKAKLFATKYAQENPKYIIRYALNVASIYAKQNDYDYALPSFNEVLDLKKQYNVPLNNGDIAYYNNLGRYYFKLKEFNHALEMFNEAVKIAQALKETEDEKMGNLYLNLGNSYVQTTDFNKAREYYNKALLIIQPEENASVEIQKIYNNIGYSYYRQEQYNDAFNYFHKSLKINNSNNIAIKSMSHLAQCYIGISEYDSAALFFDKAIRISTTNDNMFNQEYASVLQDYGQFLMEMGDEEEGISNIKKSHAIFSQQNDSRDNVASLDRIIGNHYLAKGQYEKALYHAQQALIALEPGFKDTLYLANPDIKATESPYELLGILALKAEAMAKFSEPNGQNKYLSGSIKTYNLISALFDILKTSYSYDESKLFLSVQSSLIFQNALSTAYELYNKESNVEMLNTAFMFSEKTKYSTLLEAYRESSLLNTTIPGKKIEELSSLKRMLEKANRELYEITSQNNNPDEEAINRINNRIFELNRRNDSLENIFKTNYPEYFYAKKQHPVINPQLIQNKLTNNQALIEYSLNDTVLISFCILHDKIYTQKTYINIQYIDSLRLSLNNHGFTNTTSQDFATYISSSYYLYDKLIAPYASYIDKKSLIIIPDSRLGYIPFEALITEKPTTGKKMDFRNLNYLIRTNAISYSYSSTLLFDKEHTPPGWRNPRVLAFAPEYKPGIAIDGEDFFLAPIPGVEDEVKHITTLFTGKALLKEQATEETFKEEAPQYDILHLAMHTIIDEKNPTYSKLIFTLPENPDKQNDGILYTSELFSMSLQSKMAVLSACQTGDGKLNKGEGILSLARGFFYSGVPSVVMTLWSVNDAQSAAIMSSFYTYLKKGYSKDKALRQAKLDLLDQGNPLTSHPRYWAGYVSIGEQSPIAKNRRTIVMVICIVLLAGAISFILVHRRKHK